MSAKRCITKQVRHGGWPVFDSWEYDKDHTLLNEADKHPIEVPSEYDAYFVYTQEMMDKVDEIAGKYALDLAGEMVGVLDYETDIFFDSLGIQQLHRQDADAAIRYNSSYFYACGNFNMEFDIAPTGLPYEVLGAYRYNGKAYFDTVYSSVSSIENCDEYQTEQMRLETTSDAATIAQPQPETTAAPVSQDDPVRSAFQRTLQTIHDKLYWPEVSYDAKIELSEPGTIEDEQFAIVDVDGDGEEELLVSVSNTYVAGMCEIIYGYDPQTDGVRIEAQNYVAVTHYPGMLKVDASHNHGYAGEILWPYVVMEYDEAEDAYKETFIVDAWCKAIADYDPYAEMPYPEDADTEHDGYVYLITENGQKQILNRADYQKWETQVFAQKEPLKIPWQKITAANIGALNLS